MSAATAQAARGFTLRDVGPGDVDDITRLVRALAAFEQLDDQAVATADDFRAALFGAVPQAFAMIADIDGRAVGFALWFHNFSTFLGRRGLYVEDVFVEPGCRGLGIGRAFFAALAARAVADGCGRMEWSVLDWNEDALRFYRGLGAAAMDDWTVQRLVGGALFTLAAEGAVWPTKI